MKKILIAIDYTPAAEQIAATGYALGRALKAEIGIAHVITEAAFYAMDYAPIMGYKGAYTRGSVEVLKDITKEAEDFLQAAKSHLGDERITTMVLQGDTKEAILQCCHDWNADLLVLGSHSHHGMERIFSTDISSYMINHLSIPLLSIPTKES